jgi:actin related protein 2/3 complex subunit 4
VYIWAVAYFLSLHTSPLILQSGHQSALEKYLKAIRVTLEAALCIRNFASQLVERHNKPEVEARNSKELLLQPVVVARSDKEKCLIEGSINAVRISLKIKQADEMENVLVDRFSRFLAQRAEEFIILRRCAVEGYDLSFLITNINTETLIKEKLVDFIIHFMTEVDKEISAMRLGVNSRARVVAYTFLQQFVG